MTLLIAGLVVFLGVHLVPAIPALRTALVAGLGERGYKGAFSAVSLAGLVLIVIGYGRAPAGDRLFSPIPEAIAAAPYAIAVAFILFAEANMRGHIRHGLKHPMLLGLLIWAGIHLLANGSVRGSILFGAFLVYAIVDLISALSRHAVREIVPQGKFDVMAVIGGLVVAVVVMMFHHQLFGVGVVSFGV